MFGEPLRRSRRITSVRYASGSYPLHSRSRHPGNSGIVVDDHTVVRQAIAQLVNMEHDMNVVAEAQDGREAVDAWRRLRPDITLMDLRLPDVDGVSAIGAIPSN